MRRIAALLVMVLAVAGCAADLGGAAERDPLILATTTSTDDSGLLDELLPRFTVDTGLPVNRIAVGTGQALELGRRGEADVLLVHAPEAEQQLVDTGTTGRRLLVMHNDFVIVGPPGDPAGVAGGSATDALHRIADSGQVFVSRGDDSGTEKKERGLWEQAGINPVGAWYQSTGQGMGATLRVTDEKEGYTLTDRATYLSQRDTLNLDVLVEGDSGLLNIYHVIEMTRAAGDGVAEDGAREFADWIVSPSAQALIGRFGTEEFGQPLFFPDAGSTVEELTG